MREEYDALVLEIRYHMRRYYDEDAPEISDAEYDALMRRLKQMESEHQEYVTEESPTRIIGGNALRTAGVIVEHRVPMLSIEDVFSMEEVEGWIRDVQALHPDARFSVEQKIDGLSMTLRYRDGKLILAETRGDGLQGEDVTANALVIPDIPPALNTAYPYLELRGEVYMRHADFEKTNAAQQAAGKKLFANPRNCAAGTLRQLDAGMVKERGLSFFVFNIQDAEGENASRLMASHYEALRHIDETETLPVAPATLCSTAQEVMEAIDAIGTARPGMPYDIDGAVVKIDQVAYRDDFPAGSKYSAGHIAYKYPPEEKAAIIEAIELSVGMTGRINPTAVFTPVQLNGTTVSRATLHNQEFIRELGIGIGATVRVYKSGEIIPKIRAVVKEKSPADMKVYELPAQCPVCGGKTEYGRGDERNADAADLYCTNPDCPAKSERRILNFVGRDAMDIKGFGEEYIRVLIAEGYIRNIDDLYTLYSHREELIEKGLIGKEVNTDKLLDVIEKSKRNDPWRLLAGLAIPGVGKTSARTIMRHFHSFDALRNATVEELQSIDDVGEITARSIRDYFDDESHLRMLDHMRSNGVRMTTETDQAGADDHKTDVFSGRTYVVTGELHHFKNREALIDFIEARGGKVAGSVSKKTYALINNDAASTSGKNQKAQALNIPIMTEEALLDSAGAKGESDA